MPPPIKLAPISSKSGGSLFATVAQYVLFQSTLNAFFSWLKAEGAAKLLLEEQPLLWWRS